MEAARTYSMYNTTHLLHVVTGHSMFHVHAPAIRTEQILRQQDFNVMIMPFLSCLAVPSIVQIIFFFMSFFSIMSWS